MLLNLNVYSEACMPACLAGSPTDPRSRMIQKQKFDRKNGSSQPGSITVSVSRS